ncbi:hypothetical protein DV737_g2631, partial [Chaetothyriales sp. CBS 132003]
MKNDAGSSSSRDLLARLNALKQSAIDFDQTTFSAAHTLPSAPAVDPSPARSLHSDLVDRFKSLSGKTSHGSATQATEESEDNKTVEELLADLGPVEEWEVHRSEHEQVEELLRAADVALAEGSVLENVPGDEDEQQEQQAKKTAAGARAPPVASIDVSVFQPEPDPELDNKGSNDEGGDTTAARYYALDREADNVLGRLLDEVKLEESQQQHGEGDVDIKQHDDEAADSSKTQQADDSSLLIANLPSAPSKLPDLPQTSNSKAASADDLASRFASLSLPSAPSATVQGGEQRLGKTGQGFSEDEIDSWCIICCDDATLSCIGCDGDLYCTNCWLEGHRGEAAGVEERTHKALQYVKGKKKAKARRVALGA